MTSSQSDRMFVLQLIKDGDPVPNNSAFSFCLFDLIESDMITVNDQSSIFLTYFGFHELNNWDPVLQCSINNQLLQPAHGDA